MTPFDQSRALTRERFDERLHEPLNVEWGLSQQQIREAEQADSLFDAWGVDLE